MCKFRDVKKPLKEFDFIDLSERAQPMNNHVPERKQESKKIPMGF